MCQLRDHKYIKITELNDNNEDILLHNNKHKSCNRPHKKCANDQLFMPKLRSVLFQDLIAQHILFSLFSFSAG